MIIRTDVKKSPLLRPVIEREYTKGIAVGDSSAQAQQKEPEKTFEPTPESSHEPSKPGVGEKFNIPPKSGIEDNTKEFTFDDIPEPGEIKEDDKLDGISISSASAKAFANFAGNAIQVYLPRIANRFCKVDIDNVEVNIEKGNLTPNWKAFFDDYNKRVEEGLKIPDDSILMWKKAFKEYLEYKNFAFANPETAFWAATVALLSEFGIAAYSINKTGKEMLREALAKSNPDIFTMKPKEEPEKTTKDEQSNAA
jgi:hypothetical protein